jgi:glucokinase
MTHRVLAGDIGGTNARFALVDVSGEADARIVHEARYPSAEAPGLAPLVLRYLDEAPSRPEVACFGIACPILEGECEATNLPWKVSARTLAREIGIPRTTIINDFRAAGEGLHSLSDDEVAVLQQGTPVTHGPIALIGAGTGLGQGYLLWEGSRYVVHPSEGGHADFSPTDGLQRELLASLAGEFERVSWERILSGDGLERIYRFLASVGVAPEQARVREEMAGNDPAAVIVHQAMAGTDALSVKTLDLFIRAYGTAAGNLALTVLATGGVYVTGGIAPRIVQRLASGTFMDAFHAKGRLSDVVERMPVCVILTGDVALYGAAAVAARPLLD